MEMIKTIYPYGCIAVRGIGAITERSNGFYAIDKYGSWKISETDYQYLAQRGVRVYERKCPTT